MYMHHSVIIIIAVGRIVLELFTGSEANELVRKIANIFLEYCKPRVPNTPGQTQMPQFSWHKSQFHRIIKGNRMYCGFKVSTLIPKPPADTQDDCDQVDDKDTPAVTEGGDSNVCLNEDDLDEDMEFDYMALPTRDAFYGEDTLMEPFALCTCLPEFCVNNFRMTHFAICTAATGLYGSDGCFQFGRVLRGRSLLKEIENSSTDSRSKPYAPFAVSKCERLKPLSEMTQEELEAEEKEYLEMYGGDMYPNWPEDFCLDNSDSFTETYSPKECLKIALDLKSMGNGYLQTVSERPPYFEATCKYEKVMCSRLLL